MVVQRRRSMLIYPLWLQASVLTFVVGFTVLGILAVMIYRDQPPIPARTVGPTGEVLFTSANVMDGQGVFQKYGLMEYGTIYGHGAYLDPDFTADYLHRQALLMLNLYEKEVGAELASGRVIRELRQNNFDNASGTLTFSLGQAQAFQELLPVYAFALRNPQATGPVPAIYIQSEEELRKLTAFFAWAAWTTTAQRPGFTYSYTNNWPPEPLAGNSPTADALIWSILSIIALLGGTGLMLFLFGRYDWLGWRGDEWRRVLFRPPGEVVITPGQRATRLFFLVATLLFLLQTILGGPNAHYRAEPTTFFGIDLTPFIPYMFSRTWHVQLAIFFVAAAYLATGIFITPLIAKREPPGQATLAYMLLGAVAFVVFGSLLGEAAGMRNLLGGDLWYWFGAQGWEYLDLGRFWVVHLWVEDFLELFTTATVAYIFVLLG